MAENIETRISSEQAKEAIYQAHLSKDVIGKIEGLQSNASEIDGVVGKTESFITPEMFGAIGDGIVDDSYALSLALLSTSQLVKLVGTGKYACKNIILNRYANIDLKLTNADNIEPVILINGSDINLNSTIIDTTSNYTGKALCLDDTMPYFTATSISRLKASDLQVWGWQSGTIYGTTAFYINLTKLGASFWVIDKFRSMACGKGLIVNTSLNGYWTSNKILHCQVFQFKDSPIVLNSSINAEISANYIYMEVQPTAITLDGVKILGGRNTKRNILDGEIWDWHYAPAGTKALEDFGWNTQIRHMTSRDINTNPTTNIKTIGHSTVPTMDLNIPSNAQGKCISGHADNYLAYANLRSSFTINQPNGPINIGSLSTLFSLDTYSAVGWSDLSQSDVRIIEILFNEVIVGDQCLISFDLAGIPSNVKIEYYNTSTLSWNIKLDLNNNMSTTVGRRGSDTAFDTGLSTCGGVRFTLSAPKKYNNTTYMTDIVDDTRIRITNIYFASNKNKIKSPYVDVSTPILLGDLRSSKTVTQDISSMSQTKCLKVMDEQGILLGYLPIYL